MTENFGNEIVKSVNEFHNERDAIRRKPAYQFDTPDYASDEVKRQLINEARAEEERQLVERIRERVEATLNAYPDNVMARRQKLAEKIMEPLADASADMLSRLAMSFESDLEDMVEAALVTRNEELTGMLFAEAVRRDLPELQRRITAETGGEYQEFLKLPKNRDEALAKANLQRHLVTQSLGT
jgi:hypothetical protein